MGDVEDVHRPRSIVNAIDDPVGAALCATAPGKLVEERFPDLMRVDRQRGFAKLQHGSRDGFG